MKPTKILAAGIAALGAVVTSVVAPAAAGPQEGRLLRIFVTSPAVRTMYLPDQTRKASGTDATCTYNQITVNRFSQCLWTAVHVDAMKMVGGRPVRDGTADFDVKHQMALKTNSAGWAEKFTVSRAKTTGHGNGIHVNLTAVSGGGTKATLRFPQGHTLDSPAEGSTDYKTGPIPRKQINPKAKTTYKYTFSKPGYATGSASYASAVYRCDNYYGTTGCAFPDATTAVSMIRQARIAEGIRGLRSRGGRHGDPDGGAPLHWMINDAQKDQNRRAVCSGPVPADMQREGRTSCDEFPFASTYEGGTHLPANQRTITWVNRSENDSQGASITNWRRQFHVMDHDPFFVIA